MSTAARKKPAVSTSSSDLEVRQMDRYLLVRKIAQSFSAEVFLGGIAQQSQNPKLLIIKFLHSQRSRPERDRERFFREIKMNKTLIHPNIARTIDYGEFKGEPYIVMEWIEGKDLRQLIHHSRGTIPGRLAAYIIHQVASGLIHLNKNSIVHRDLSPHNVMLSYRGDIKIIDFGVAKAISVKNQTLTDGLIGKPNYLSPEQAIGAELDPRSDIFSLGSIFFELLTGVKAFDAENEFAILEKIKACETFDPTRDVKLKNAPDEYLEVIRRCLRKNPEDRFSNAQELVNSINYLLKDFPDISHQSELSDYVCDLFSEDRSIERRWIERCKDHLRKKQDISYPEISLGSIESPVAATSKSFNSSSLDDRERNHIVESAVYEGTPSISLDKSKPNLELVKNQLFDDQPKPKSKFHWYFGFVVLLLASVGAWNWYSNSYSLDEVLNSTPVDKNMFQFRLKVYPEGGERTQVTINREQLPFDVQDIFELKRNVIHKLRVTKTGYEELQKILLEPNGSQLNEAIFLSPKRFGKVRIQTNAGVHVVVTDRIHTWEFDGPEKTLELPPGQYFVNMSKKGMFSDLKRTTVVTVDVGSLALLKETL